MRPRALAIAGLAALLAQARPAGAGPIEGRVFVDANRDGTLSRGEETLSGVQVAWETEVFATSGEDGLYELDAPDEDGIVWARVPDGYRPGPVWGQVGAGGGTVDLPLVDIDVNAPAHFVVASDLHIGKEKLNDPGESLDDDDLERSLRQAAALVDAPRFFALTGDLVQSNQPQHYAILRDVAADLGVPVVPVPGNHDWFDGGASYRATMGPPMYSFDSDGVHYIVLNDNASVSEWSAFLLQDTGDLEPAVPLVGFIHRPPEPPELTALEAAGIDYLFTGHWHSNMTHQFGTLLQINTEPFVRGGIDGTPAGFRVVEITADGLRGEHRTVVERPVLRLVAPALDQCAGGDVIDLIAAVEVGEQVERVRAHLGDEIVDLEPAGAWSWSARVEVPDSQPDSVVLEAVHKDGTVTSTMQPLNDCTCSPDVIASDWPQTQGGPEHGGRAPALEPPLHTEWVAALGAHPTAAPAVAGGRVFVSLADYDTGERGGVAALDLTTGATLWRFEPGADVRAGVAVKDGVVVVPGADGVVHGVDAVTGRQKWSHDLANGLPPTTGILHAPPTIAGDVAYVAVHRQLAALDLETGDVIWQADPAPDGNSLTSRAAPAVSDGILVATVARGRHGAFAWQAASGDEMWRLSPEDSVGIHASPVIDGDFVYLVNASAKVLALDRQTGEVEWTTSLVGGAGDWDYGVISTPALADGRLFVPTMYDDLVALDLVEGAVLWRSAAGESALHDAHSRSLSRSFPTSPVVTGDVVWILGGDGVLRALAASSGESQWTLDLGVPGNGGIAPAGDRLLVATYDGTVRSLVNARCVPDDGGCGCGASPGSGGAGILVWAILAATRRRRRKS